MNGTYKIKFVNKHLVFSTLFLVSWSACAVNPVPGFYAGIMLGVNYSPSISLDFPYPETNVVTSGTAFYSILGNIAGQAGYRCNHLRVEGELFYNNNPIRSLELGTTTFNSVSKYSSSEAVKAQTNTGAFMINAFYDFYTPGQTVYFSPYVGLGIGYAYVNTTTKFYDNSYYIPGTNITESGAAPGGQVILGLGYFLDDFTTVGLDLRYFSTKGPVATFNSRMQIATVNITINGSFDRG